jgi:predicted NUDIX family NTP pyrophosphohydrolase
VTSKAKKTSAGILLYRALDDGSEVFLVHPGGPYWEKKDDGAWSVPKGEFEEGEAPLEAAKREFREETGSDITGEFIELSPLKQPSGKIVYVWAVEGNIDATSIRSNMFTMEWPPRSGKEQVFPEVDKGGWFTISQAHEKLLVGQRGFLEQLQKYLGMD